MFTKITADTLVLPFFILYFPTSLLPQWFYEYVLIMEVISGVRETFVTFGDDFRPQGSF